MQAHNNHLVIDEQAIDTFCKVLQFIFDSFVVTDDGEAFYQRVAAQLNQEALTLDQRDKAFKGRLHAIKSYELYGPMLPASGPGLVYQVAWLITQDRLIKQRQEARQS